MPCDKYKDLQIEVKYARQEAAQLLSLKLPKASAKREAKRRVNNAHAKIREATALMHWHEEHCQECKKPSI